jgi:3-hydroxyisobutyrate dehydrogenase
MTTAPKVGFIGLGAMGRGMARCLHLRGLLECVWNRSAAASDEIARDLQVPVAAGLVELAAACDVVVLCVSADTDVLDVVDQLAGSLRPGSIVIDCSTVSADTAREAARRRSRSWSADPRPRSSAQGRCSRPWGEP